MKITRRALAKGLAASGTAAALSNLLTAETQAMHVSVETSEWKQIYPGVWRATLGKPERFTPVESRLVPVQTAAFEKQPRVDAVPLAAIKGRRLTRGFLLEVPLRPGEEVYGLGLQMMSLAQRGKKKVVRVNADPKMDTGDAHAPVPFYVTTEGI